MASRSRSLLAAFLAATALLAPAGCESGDSGGGAIEAPPGSGSPPGPGDGAPGTSPQPTPATTPEAPPGPAPAPGATTPARPTPAAPAPRLLNPNGPVGSFGPAFLAPDVRARVEVLVEDGAAPGPRTVPALAAALGEVAGKAVPTSGPVAVPRTGGWTADRIRQTANQLGARTTATEVVVRLLFLTGEFADEPSAIGVAVDATTAAVFTEKVAGASGLLGDRSRVEIAVATHEAGHLLGLVDLVLDTGREDPGHPGHSPSRDSVMFWAVESDLIGTLLTGGPPTAFDAADRADLDQIRRRG